MCVIGFHGHFAWFLLPMIYLHGCCCRGLIGSMRDSIQLMIRSAFLICLFKLAIKDQQILHNRYMVQSCTTVALAVFLPMLYGFSSI